MNEWIRGRAGWLRDRPAKRPAEPPLAAPDPKKLDVEYSVPYIPVKCPQCGSKKVPCYCTQLPVRYHKCTDCGCNFKSVEEV